MSKLIEKALRAKRESKRVDFKSSFDPESAGEWCELVKDIVAMANSGGGVIAIGLDNGGVPSKIDVKTVLELHQAKIVDKIHKYTGYAFGDIEVHEAKKQEHTVALIEISAVKVPPSGSRRLHSQRALCISATELKVNRGLRKIFATSSTDSWKLFAASGSMV